MRRRDPVIVSLVIFAASVVVASFAFGWYLVQHQRIADHRADTQRKAICAILANIPGRVPAEIENARLVFARPHHPHDCQPLPRPKPTPTPPPESRERPVAGPTYIVVRPPQPSREPSPGPTSHPTRSPRPTHSPTPRPTHSPHPTPSPSCILPPPLRCPI